MADNSIVPYSSIEEYNDDDEFTNVRVVRRKSRRKGQKSRLRGLILFSLTIILFMVLYSNNDFIKNHTDNIISKVKNTLFSSEISDNEKQNNEKDKNNDKNGGESVNNPVNDGQNGEENNTPTINGDYRIYEDNMSYSNKFYNETSYPVDISSLSYIRPNINYLYSVYGDAAPVVLIIHSNANECYSDGVSYSKGDSFYSEYKNVSSLGKVMSDILNENGINTIHIDNVFGGGVIHNSSKEYKNAISSLLAQYPSISYVFDISRDMLINSDMTMTKPVFELNGTKYAQIKFTIGSDKITENKNWKSNLAFSSLIENFISQKNEDLIYRYSLSSFSLNQNTDTISAKIDMGAYSNTYEEAYESTLILSDYLIEFLK